MKYESVEVVWLTERGNRTYYTGTGEGTAELECDTGDDELNEGWKAGGEDPFSSREKTCEETEVAVEVTAMEAIA